MNTAQIDRVIEFAQQFGIAGLIVCALSYVAIQYIKHRKPNGNGGKNKTLDEATIKNTKEIGGLQAALKLIDENNAKDHALMREQNKENFERVHQRLDGIDETLIKLAEKNGIAHSPR